MVSRKHRLLLHGISNFIVDVCEFSGQLKQGSRINLRVDLQPREAISPIEKCRLSLCQFGIETTLLV